MAVTKNARANGQIPADWSVAKVADFGKVHTGNTPLTSEIDNYDGDFFFVSPGDLSEEKFISKTEKTLTEKGFLSARKFPKGSVLFTCIGSTIGKSGIATTDLAANQQINAIVVNDDNLNEFLYYQLERNAKRIKLIAGEQAVPIINKSQFEKVKVLRAPLPEQRAIAKVLGKMDEAINANKQLIAQKELRKKWLMQNLLTGKKRLKGFGGEWEEYSLGEMFAERNERNTDELPLLSIGQNGVYPQGESIKKDTSNTDKSKYKKICVGDIGYNTMRMWQGRSALSTLEGIVSPAYTILKPKKAADALFFSYLFRTPKMVNLFWRNSQGLVGDTLNCKYKDFSIVKAVLPLKDEQTAIAQILQAVDKELSLLKAKTEKLKEQKKGMMQVLLTGKKRLNQDLQDLNIYRINALEHNLESPANSESPNPNNNLENPKNL
jgi:type I restriction enzyme S subunit